MPKWPSQQCYRLLMSETPDHRGAVEECAKAIMELGSDSAVYMTHVSRRCVRYS
jgi:hypothetical protein